MQKIRSTVESHVNRESFFYFYRTSDYTCTYYLAAVVDSCFITCFHVISSTLILFTGSVSELHDQFCFVILRSNSICVRDVV